MSEDSKIPWPLILLGSVFWLLFIVALAAVQILAAMLGLKDRRITTTTVHTEKATPKGIETTDQTRSVVKNFK